MATRRALAPLLCGVAAALWACGPAATRPAGVLATGGGFHGGSSLSTEELGRLHYGTVEEMLQGRIAGLEVIPRPGGRYSLRVRGIGSLVGDGEPLVVIDGTEVPQDGMGHPFVGLRPSDILRVEVLKNVASTAVYGYRGANGVILVTTRRR